jgi:hypothetical protein
MMDFMQKYGNQASIIGIMRNEGLLAECIKCDKCNENMHEGKRDGSDGVRWLCKKRNCRRSKSIRENSFFANTKLTLYNCMLLLHLWSNEFTEKLILNQFSFATQTVVDWANYCRELCVIYFDNQNDKIGGVGTIVELDETVIVKRKYDRGRVLKEGWLFGGIERTTDGSFKCFMRVVYNRSENHLVHIIQSHVYPGTHIITDGWAAYRNLEKFGYKHSVVVHETNFVSPENTIINTQKIESTWCSLKRFIRSRGTHKGDYYVDYIYEWIFRRIHPDVFESLLHVIRSEYNFNE